MVEGDCSGVKLDLLSPERSGNGAHVANTMECLDNVLC